MPVRATKQECLNGPLLQGEECEEVQNHLVLRMSSEEASVPRIRVVKRRLFATRFGSRVVRP